MSVTPNNEVVLALLPKLDEGLTRIALVAPFLVPRVRQLCVDEAVEEIPKLGRHGIARARSGNLHDSEK